MPGDFRTITIRLFQYLSSIFVLIYLFSNTKGFKNIMKKGNTTLMQKLLLILVFGAVSVMGTYTGFPVKNAIANTRAIGIIAAGLVAGPLVGTGVGVISGVHRYLLGGLTINAAVISAVLQGYISGIFYTKLKYKKSILFESLIIGAILELLHMVIILIASRPLDAAIKTVTTIGPPMTIINSLGVMLILAILENAREDREKTEGWAAETALEIANKTLPFMKKGLNRKSAQRTANIVFEMVGDFDVVCLTSKDRVLGYIQRGLKTSLSTDNSLFSDNILRSLETGRIISFSSDQFGNSNHLCRIIIPLKIEDKAVGTMVLSKNFQKNLTHYEVKLAKGLAQLISTQLEISKGQYQSQLVAQAEIKALQAQINPHFLFNSLNTIVYYCLVDPHTAKKLIIHLGEFYRKNIVNLNKMVDLEVEIQHVKSYMVIELARFEGKLNVRYDIAPNCRCMVPPLILQPIVENCIRHGILPMRSAGKIAIEGKVRAGCVILTIEDDGVGMTDERITEVFERNNPENKIGLRNVKSRIKNIYGDSSLFKIDSEVGKGTRITIGIPVEWKEGENESSYCG